MPKLPQARRICVNLNGRRSSDPAANQEGLVARPNVDTEAELLNVSRARRAYQSSLKVIETEDEMAGGLIDNPT